MTHDILIQEVQCLVDGKFVLRTRIGLTSCINKKLDHPEFRFVDNDQNKVFILKCPVCHMKVVLPEAKTPAGIKKGKQCLIITRS